MIWSERLLSSRILANQNWFVDFLQEK